MNALKQLDYIGVYFAAHWAPESEQFTPLLVRSYSTIHNKMRDRQDHRHWDIIYVSSDRTQEEFDAVFAEMPWKALPFNDERTGALHEMFDVEQPSAQSSSYQPTLAIVDAKSGEIVSLNVCDKLQQDRDGERFPWRRLQSLQGR